MIWSWQTTGYGESKYNACNIKLCIDGNLYSDDTSVRHTDYYSPCRLVKEVICVVLRYNSWLSRSNDPNRRFFIEFHPYFYIIFARFVTWTHLLCIALRRSIHSRRGDISDTRSYTKISFFFLSLHSPSRVLITITCTAHGWLYHPSALMNRPSVRTIYTR